ncbi:hypothetical protein V3331_18200 [Gaopeijia maritima]
MGRRLLSEGEMMRSEATSLPSKVVSVRDVVLGTVFEAEFSKDGDAFEGGGKALDPDQHIKDGLGAKAGHRSTSNVMDRENSITQATRERNA